MSRGKWRNPYRVYGLVVFVSILIVAGIAFLILRDLLWSYLIGVNLVSFLLYGFDKLAAKAKWLRVPETILIASVWALGLVGAECGRRLFHHKTVDVEFRRRYWFAAAINAAAAVAYLVWFAK